MLRGLKHALPIVMGYIPVGFAFGVLADKTGISTVNAMLMSLFVYAGSAQLIAVGLIGAAAAPITIVLTTLIVNLRHLLMCAALTPHLKGWSKGRLALFAHEVTDETFAVHSLRFSKGDTSVADSFAVNVTAHVSWLTGTVLGLFASTLISDVRPIGLDYALPAMFIALLVAQTKNKLHVLVALSAGCLAVALSMAGLDRSNVIVATVAAAALGAYLEAAWTSKRS